MRPDLLRPRALLGHLLVLVVAGACVALGLWQLDRLGQVREHNDRLETRLEQGRVDLGELVAAGELDDAALEFRRAEVSGTFRPEQEVLQRGQQDPRGQQGYHLLTPLELEAGGVVLVRRGWVPTGLDRPPVGPAAPPEGDVRVIGVLERPVPQPGFGPQDPPDGHLERVFHPDTTRLDRQVEGDLLPIVLRLEEQHPSRDAEFPVVLGPPALDEGNHLSYAVQWFIFAVLALGTYGAWLLNRRRQDDPPPAEGHEAPAPRPGALT